MENLALPHGSIVAFYGDSLTSGFRASSADLRWSTLLCRRHGWIEVNPSVPGLGFVQDRGDSGLPALIVEAHPDAILVTLGANDLRLVDSAGAQIKAAIADDLARLRAGAPEADIFVAMPFSPLSFRPPQLVLLEGWLREGAASISAPVIESASWMTGRADLTVDGIHFSDEGERYIADLMDEALAAYVAGT